MPKYEVICHIHTRTTLLIEAKNIRELIEFTEQKEFDPDDYRAFKEDSDWTGPEVEINDVETNGEYADDSADYVLVDGRLQRNR